MSEGGFLKKFLKLAEEHGDDPSMFTMMGKRGRLDMNAEADTRALRTDVPRVKAALEVRSYNLVDHIRSMDPSELHELHEAITKEKSCERALKTLARFAPAMPDLYQWKADLDVRCATAESHSHAVTTEALAKSQFFDDMDGFMLTKLKRYVSGLHAVNVMKPNEDKGEGTAQAPSRKAKTLSDGDEDADEDEEDDESKAKVPRKARNLSPLPRKRGLFSGWI